MSDIDDAKPDANPEDGCDREACGEDSDSLESDVSKLTNKSWKDDLALVVEDKQLYINRSILAYASPVFDAMFSGEYKEKYVNEMPLPGKKFEDVVEFLRCITPGMMRPITMNNVFKVLPLAHEYQVVYLESACEVCFVHHLAENLKSVQVYEIMKNAMSYELNKIKEKCIDIMAERPREEFEEATLGFMFPEDVLNAIRAEMLRTLQTKYKHVFSHVQTSRALYQFLGLEAKQCDLVERYTEGRVLGDCANLKVSSSLKASTDIIIDGRKIHIDIDKCVYYSGERVSIKFESDEAQITCVVAIYILNWMNGKDNKGHIEKIELGRNPKSISIEDWKTSLLRKEEAGFNFNGSFEFRFYLFCLK